MICYVMLCYVMICYVTLCYDMLWFDMLCYVMLCYAMLCYAMLCYVMLCYIMLCNVSSCYMSTCHVVLQLHTTACRLMDSCMDGCIHMQEGMNWFFLLLLYLHLGDPHAHTCILSLYHSASLSSFLAMHTYIHTH